jgi:drug/metabolite transporter (DMT)-like permease
MIISALAFTFMGVAVRLSGDIPVFEKVFFRNFVSFFVALYIIYKSKGSLFGKKKNRLLLNVRSFLGLAGVILNFYAIGRLPLADSNMLNKLSPFFVTLFAFWFLKEKLNKAQVIALIGAFISSMLVIKPEFSMTMLPGLAGFLSAISAGAAYTIIRSLSKDEDPSTIVFYFSFISVTFMLPLMVIDYVRPTFIQLVWLLSTGVFASIGQFMVTMAYKYAPAGEVSVYNYSSIVFSTLVAYMIWGEIPDNYSITGGVLIILIAVMLFNYNKKYSK